MNAAIAVAFLELHLRQPRARNMIMSPGKLSIESAPSTQGGGDYSSVQMDLSCCESRVRRVRVSPGDHRVLLQVCIVALVGDSSVDDAPTFPTLALLV